MLLHVDLLVALHLYILSTARSFPERKSQTHPVFSKKCEVLLRELTAVLIVIDTLGAITTLELVADNASFHGLHPGFSDVLVAGSQPR
jgi:hypothetical protein